MDYFPRKSLSKYLITETIDFNKHVHDIDIFINVKWGKYAGNYYNEVILTNKIKPEIIKHFAFISQRIRAKKSPCEG
jgi:hypothetical protein